MHKKIIKIMLCALMLISCCSMFIFAEGEDEVDPDADLMGYNVVDGEGNTFHYNFYVVGDNGKLLSRPGSSTMDDNLMSDTLYFGVGVLENGNTASIPGITYFNEITDLSFSIDTNDSRTTLADVSNKITLENTSTYITKDIAINGITVKKNTKDPLNGNVIVKANFKLNGVDVVVKHLYKFVTLTSLSLTISGDKDISAINNDIKAWIAANTNNDGSQKQFMLNFASDISGDIVIDVPDKANYNLSISGNGKTLNGSITIKNGIASVNNLMFVKNNSSAYSYGVSSDSKGLGLFNCAFGGFETAASKVSISEKCTYNNCGTAIDTSILGGVNGFDPEFTGNTFNKCGTGLKITKYTHHVTSSALSVSDNDFINCETEFDIAHSLSGDEYFFFLNNYYENNGNYESPTIKGTTSGLYVVTSPARMFRGDTNEIGVDNTSGIISALFNGKEVNINKNSVMDGARFVVFDEDTGKAVGLVTVPERIGG